MHIMCILTLYIFRVRVRVRHVIISISIASKVRKTGLSQKKDTTYVKPMAGGQRPEFVHPDPCLCQIKVHPFITLIECIVSMVRFRLNFRFIDDFARR